MRVQPFTGNVVYDLGQGIYRWADVILGGLDNREARVAINLAAARAGKVWIDGAIERLDGVARVFDPATGPCYECTMGENDWKMLEARRSCALLSRDEMEQGKVPTTPTTASIIAGIQVQEAVKYLHGLEVIAGQGFVFDGTHHQSYLVRYTRKDDCPAHEADEPVEIAPRRRGRRPGSATCSSASARTWAPRRSSRPAATCWARSAASECGEEEPVFASLGKVTEAQGRCPRCGRPRTPSMFHTIDGRRPDVLDMTLAAIGIPAWDVLGGRAGWERRFYELCRATVHRSWGRLGSHDRSNETRRSERLLASERPAGRDLPRRPERGVSRVLHPRGPRRPLEARRRGHLGRDLRRAGGDAGIATRSGRSPRWSSRSAARGPRPSSPR